MKGQKVKPEKHESGALEGCAGKRQRQEGRNKKGQVMVLLRQVTVRIIIIHAHRVPGLEVSNSVIDRGRWAGDQEVCNEEV